MLSILLLSHKGEGHEIADRLVQDGHVVRFWNQSGFRGTPQEVHRYEDCIEATDLVVAASSRVGGICDSLRERGKLVLGGGVQSTLESPEFARMIAKMMNVSTEPPPKEGVSIVVCGFFLGDRWGHTFLAQNYRRLLDGERGPQTSSMGYMVWRAEGLLNHLVSFLSEAQYRGFVGVRIELVDDVPYFVGFETSLSGGLIPAIIECTRTRLDDLLLSTARGQDVSLRGQDLFGLSVKIVSFNAEELRVTDLMARHVWLSPDETSLGYITAAGDTPREARRRCYRTIGNATTLDHVYRGDIGAQSIYDWQRRTI